MSPLNFFEDYRLDCNKCQLKALPGPWLFRISLVLFSLKQISRTNSIDHGFSHIKHTTQGPSVPKRNFGRLFWTLSAITISQTGSIIVTTGTGQLPHHLWKKSFSVFLKTILVSLYSHLPNKRACFLSTYIHSYVLSSMLVYSRTATAVAVLGLLDRWE